MGSKSSESITETARPDRRRRGDDARKRRDDTKSRILDAALEVFLERGYADASVAEIVERSAASVGSVYHHFGGKGELYVALWQDYQRAYLDAAQAAVRAAKESGEADPADLLVAGTRAYLERAWAQRELAALFLGLDAPAELARLQRQIANEWIRQNARLLRSTGPEGRLQVAILTGMIGDATHAVVHARDRRECRRLIARSLHYVRLLATDRGE